MSEALILIAAFIAVMALWLAALWLFGCIHGDSGFDEPSAKPEPRRVRAGQPVVDLDACERAGRDAGFADSYSGGKTPNPHIKNSQAAVRWAIGQTEAEEFTHAMRSDLNKTAR